MNAKRIVMEITRIEAAHLAGLVSQFTELLDESAMAGSPDPALRRLAPDAYADDLDAAQEFRAMTESDILDGRRADAARVLSDLREAADLPDDPDDTALLEAVEVGLDPQGATAWLRTLAAVRLVLAGRLGVFENPEPDLEDPRHGIYDWLGYRLESLVAAVDD